MSFWDIPGMKAGVVTGDLAWALLQHAKELKQVEAQEKHHVRLSFFMVALFARF